ncbi:hypothetical protein [Porphyromonas gulae]|uniref:hypothetical protein n=1 Tax=Porphyromonas gulae TaxID=111105 RepID=UPI000A9C849E|nr:hypothetical protein [Porphyromonas gulae]
MIVGMPMLTLTAKLANGSTMSARIKDKKRCRVEFNASYESIKNGEFGFDSFENAKNGCLDLSALKEEYKVYADINNKEYITPWVSMRVGQTIVLDLKIKGNFEETEEISHPNLTFEPNKITPETKQIKITCNALFEKETLVEVKADGEPAGAINFFPNTPKKVKLRWVVVEINEGDKDKIKATVQSKSILDTYFKKAFNPAVIDIEVENTEPYKLIIPYQQYKKHISKKEDVKKEEDKWHSSPSIDIDPQIESFVKDTIDCFESKSSLKYIDKTRIKFAQRLFRLNVFKNSVEANRVYLFLTNLKCKTDKDELTGYNNGITAGNVSVMFLGNKGHIDPATEIPHEVMHVLGAGHTFQDDRNKNQKHFFNKTETDNYMDYNNKKTTTWKWQWEDMRESANVH